MQPPLLALPCAAFGWDGVETRNGMGAPVNEGGSGERSVQEREREEWVGEVEGEREEEEEAVGVEGGAMGELHDEL